jgi:hypothetical protein
MSGDERPSAPPPTPAPAPPAPPTSIGPSKRTIWIASTAAALLLALGVWLIVVKLPHLLTAPDETPAAATSTSGDARRIQATLFYVSEGGDALIPVAREVPYANTPADQVKRILEMQTSPPPGIRRSALPVGTTVRNVFLTKDGDAFVDLGGAIVSGHTGGSLDEALTVYTIVNAVTFNLPDVTRVQILVEGKQVDTLVGHMDLRSPLSKAPEWVRKG